MPISLDDHPLAPLLRDILARLDRCADLTVEHWRVAVMQWPAAAHDMGGIDKDDFASMAAWSIAGWKACEKADAQKGSDPQ